jgi:hypothetical protein
MAVSVKSSQARQIPLTVSLEFESVVGGVSTVPSLVPKGIAYDLVAETHNGGHEMGMSPQALFASVDHGAWLDDTVRIAQLQSRSYYLRDDSYRVVESEYDFSDTFVVTIIPTYRLPACSVAVIINSVTVCSLYSLRYSPRADW